MPKERRVRSKWGQLTVKVRPDGVNPRRLEITSYFRLDEPLVQPADFAEFRKFHEEVSKAWRVWLEASG